ncbi:hypothetical protein EII17_06225 [Clostridiales bacterium COT073_COT-073]|nr:hypothetical protein EII17_06225 [Clostridiales bacterium COT073_COT-073]
MFKNLFIILLVTAIACAAAFGLTLYNKYGKQLELDSKKLSIETLNDIIPGKGQNILKEDSFRLDGFENILVEDIVTEDYRILKATENDELSVLVEDFTNETGYIINNGVLEKVIDLKEIQDQLTPSKIIDLINESK